MQPAQSQVPAHSQPQPQPQPQQQPPLPAAHPHSQPQPRPPTLKLQIQNIAATVNLGVKIDLQAVANSVRNAEYNPSKFPAVIMRVRDPRTSALVFATGKMVVTGAKTENDSKTAAQKYIYILNKLALEARFLDYKIHLMTGTFDTGFPIRLEALVYAHARNCTYEPELFSGLIYRMQDPKIAFLIFVTGKVVITGAKSTEALRTATTKLFPILNEFRKSNLVISHDAS